LIKTLKKFVFTHFIFSLDSLSYLVIEDHKIFEG